MQCSEMLFEEIFTYKTRGSASMDRLTLLSFACGQKCPDGGDRLGLDSDDVVVVLFLAMMVAINNAVVRKLYSIQ